MFARDAGYSSPDELIGKTDFDLIWKDQAGAYRADDKRVMETAEAKLNFEELQTTPDGRTIWLKTSKIPLREDSRIIGVLGLYEDITALKQAEQAVITQKTVHNQDQEQHDQRLRDYQFYTRSLFDANIDALVTVDYDGIITDANKQMGILTDCTREELVGVPLKKLFTHPEQIEANVVQVLNNKRLNDCELTLLSRDGTETVMSCNMSTLYDRNRQLKGLLISAHNITERKRMDQLVKEKNIALEHSMSLAESANRAKSEFLSRSMLDL